MILLKNEDLKAVLTLPDQIFTQLTAINGFREGLCREFPWISFCAISPFPQEKKNRLHLPKHSKVPCLKTQQILIDCRAHDVFCRRCPLPYHGNVVNDFAILIFNRTEWPYTALEI